MRMLVFKRDHTENDCAVRDVKCLHDLRLVCPLARYEGQAMDDRRSAFVADRFFRIHDPSPCQSHRTSGDVGLTIENFARGHLFECFRSFCDFFHEGENHLELCGGRLVLDGCCIFPVPQVIWLFSE